MKVLYLTDNPNLGSTVRILQGWLPWARDEGVEALVVTPPGSKFLEWLAQHKIPATTSPMPWFNRTWPFPSLWHAWRLARWARRHAVDVIHCNEHNVYPFGSLVRKLYRRPLVCHARYQMGRGFCTWAFGGTRQPDALLWTSQQQKQDCAEAIAGVVPEEKQHLIHLGLDLSVFGRRHQERERTRQAWGFSPEQLVIGQVCALRPRKRLEEFIELVTTLAREDERVVGVLAGGVVAGDEVYRDKLLDLVDQSGLGPRFRWLGNVDDVEPIYQAMDVFVSTSEYETFGNSVCEAMACSRPVAAYRGGSVEEVVGPAGLVVDNGEVRALIEAVRSCVAQPARRQELGQQARQRVEESFNPRVSLRKLVSVYRSLRA